MKHVVLAVVTVCFHALSVEAAAPGHGYERCEEDNGSCRETCTLEFGTDPTQRQRLGICFGRCDSERGVCQKRVAQSEQKAQEPSTPAALSTSSPTPRKPAQSTAPAAADPVPELVIRRPEGGTPPATEERAPPPRHGSSMHRIGEGTTTASGAGAKAARPGGPDGTRSEADAAFGGGAEGASLGSAPTTGSASGKTASPPSRKSSSAPAPPPASNVSSSAVGGTAVERRDLSDDTSDSAPSAERLSVQPRPSTPEKKPKATAKPDVSEWEPGVVDH